MKLHDLFESKSARKPIIYVDMDGVLADLFNTAAELTDVTHYNQMSKEQWERFLKDSNAYDLFRNLKPFTTANDLIGIVKKFAGKYTILSSPLSYDKEGSMRGKREWLKKHLKIPPDHIIFEHDKYKYAVQPDGTPNILIDDFGTNTRAWTAAGGIAIKYQADEDGLDKVVKGLELAYKRIKDK